MKLFADFKKFAFKGNVIDMAVGVVIGGAFGKIVTSLVNDLITPLISLITGGANFSELFVILNPEKIADGYKLEAIKTIDMAKEAGLATLNYGNFIQTVIDFLLIAVSIFIFVKIVQKSREKIEALEKKKKTEEAAAEPPKPTSEELLAEIRDLLKEQNK